MVSDGVFAAARGIRAYLPQLLDSAAAKELDTEIAKILAEGSSNDDTEQQLRTVLEGRDETDAFLDTVLDDAPHFRPPQIQPPTLKGSAFNPLPGDPGRVIEPMFVCPRGDYDWWQEYVEAAIPACPTHHCTLVRA